MKYLPLFALLFVGACSTAPTSSPPPAGSPPTLAAVVAKIASAVQAGSATYEADVCPVLPTVEQTSAAIGAAVNVNVAGNGAFVSGEAVGSILCAALAPKDTATPLPSAAAVVPAATVSPN